MLMRKKGKIQASFLIYISHYSQNISTTKHGNKILQRSYFTVMCSFILENRNLASYRVFGQRGPGFLTFNRHNFVFGTSVGSNFVLVGLTSQGRLLYRSLLPSQTLQIIVSLQIILEGPEALPPSPPPGAYGPVL